MGSRFTILALAILIFSCGNPKTWDGAFPDPVARPEHPRPDFRRDTFINLNTKWDFAYDPDDRGLREEWFKRSDVWTHKIQVPFAWEAPLSGLVPPHQGPYSIFDTLQAKSYRGVGWYRLKLPGRLPHTKGLNWHLIFGAVDFKSTVWINGKEATEHEGGYDPFSVNLADWIGPNDTPEIVLRVEDFTELNDYAQPVGKQGGVWYTRTSGIWQTVYLEQRPGAFITRLQIGAGAGATIRGGTRGFADSVRVRVHASRPVEARIRLESADENSTMNSVETPTQGDQEVDVMLRGHFKLWDVGSSRRYELDLWLDGTEGPTDHVNTIIGLATTRTGWIPDDSSAVATDLSNQQGAVWIHSQPRYLRCVLDQSYYPDGIYTAPSVEAIRADLELAKSFGFNCIRLHIKMDEPIKYHLADELGLYVIYDIPALDLQAKNVPGFKGREYFEHTLRAAIERDANHPSIIAWTIFNENWGLLSNGSLTNPVLMGDNPDIQKWVKDMVALARSLDPTRPVEDNSAGGVVQRFEHIDTDLNSFHYYGNDMAKFREFLAAEEAGTFPGSTRNFVGGALQDGDPWFNSEFASFSTLGAPEGSGIFCDLFGMLNEMRRVPKLVGYVLTQLTDLEYELNGLVNYDRSPKPDLCTRNGVALKDLLGDDFIAFDWLPGHELAANSPVKVPLRYSHWSTGAAEPRKLRLRWDEDALYPFRAFGMNPHPDPLLFKEREQKKLPLPNRERAGVRVFPLRLNAYDASTEWALDNYSPYAVTLIESPEITAPASPGEYTLVSEVIDAGGSRICANRLSVTIK